MSSKSSLIFLLFVLLGLGLACAQDELQSQAGWSVPQDIPRIKIQTHLDDYWLHHDQVQSTAEYIAATLSIDGQAAFQDLGITPIIMRGRGHSTFAQPKKPYKLKLPSPSSLLGLPAGQNWALLANFQDGPLMANILAMKMGQILQMPFTPLLVPVEVTINNQYQGLYWLTAHKEVAPERIALDEGGWLLELTKDEPKSEDPQNPYFYQEQTRIFNLPFRVHYPPLHELAKEDLAIAQKQWASIMDYVQQWEESLTSSQENPDQSPFVDQMSLARLLIIYQFTRNIAINKPQSIYVHKNKTTLLSFGPLWDFDEAYGGTAQSEYFIHHVQDNVFLEQEEQNFFAALLQDPALAKLANKEWKKFRNTGLSELRAYMTDYIDLLDRSGAYERDFARWHKEQNKWKGTKRKSLRAYEKDMHWWLDQRSGYMDEFFKDWKKSRKP